MSILPTPLNTLLFSVDALEADLMRSSEVDLVLKFFKNDLRLGGGKESNIRRRQACQGYQSGIILRSLFRYFEICDGGVKLKVDFPLAGFAVLGPPYTKNGDNLDINRYIRAWDSLLSVTTESDPIRRDIFCYLMQFIVSIYDSANDSYRSDAHVCAMTRFSMATKFAPYMLKLQCSTCQNEIEEDNEDCADCAPNLKHIRAEIMVALKTVPSTKQGKGAKKSSSAGESSGDDSGSAVAPPGDGTAVEAEKSDHQSSTTEAAATTEDKGNPSDLLVTPSTLVTQTEGTTPEPTVTETTLVTTTTTTRSGASRSSLGGKKKKASKASAIKGKTSKSGGKGKGKKSVKKGGGGKKDSKKASVAKKERQSKGKQARDKSVKAKNHPNKKSKGGKKSAKKSKH
ncbi:unnamed protein product [Dibothriocephalus latus]|uniref:Uncharacterized protein n=1 Tax=Dibothriocephalus latus TaxID=60516 RepID=A0A3P7MK98_DIBLA|nr:unnamed protein product [Dibothriocephalus latus]